MKIKFQLLAIAMGLTACQSDADYRRVTDSQRVREGIYKQEGSTVPYEAAGAESQSREGIENPFLVPEGKHPAHSDVTKTNGNNGSP